MICYKDKTFCNSDCINTSCHRFFGAEQSKAANAWWGSDNAPVSMQDFSPACDDYEQPDEL